MKIRALAVCLCLLVAASVEAQHPCDVVQPTLFRYNVNMLPTLTVGWCFAPVDTNGVPLVEAVGFTVQVNGGPDIDLGIVLPQSLPNTQGVMSYKVTVPGLAAGAITVKAYTASAGMSAPSTPVTLTLLGSPKKVTNVVIDRGGL
jgi:hypothetical protein